LTKDVDFQTLTAQAKKSCFLVAGVLLAIGAWNVYKERPPVYFTLAGISAVLLLLGLLWPAGARGFHKEWMAFAAVLGYINARIILGAMFFLAFTPMGLISRIFGRNPMNRSGLSQETYWIPRQKTRQAPDQFERLF